jgi:hypothetical protein
VIKAAAPSNPARLHSHHKTHSQALNFLQIYFSKESFFLALLSIEANTATNSAYNQASSERKPKHRGPQVPSRPPRQSSTSALSSRSSSAHVQQCIKDKLPLSNNQPPRLRCRKRPRNERYAASTQKKREDSVAIAAVSDAALLFSS